MVKTVKQKKSKSKLKNTRSKKNGGGQSVSKASLLNNDFEPTSMLDEFVLENKEKLEGFTNEQIIKIFILSLEHHYRTLKSVAHMYRNILSQSGILTNIHEDIKMPVRGEDDSNVVEETVVPETFDEEEKEENKNTLEEVVVQEQFSTPPRNNHRTPPRFATPKEESNTPNKLELGKMKNNNKNNIFNRFPDIDEL